MKRSVRKSASGNRFPDAKQKDVKKTSMLLCYAVDSALVGAAFSIQASWRILADADAVEIGSHKKGIIAMR
jgi:hypothetical protein